MTKGDFSARQQKAIEEMLKMNEQSQNKSQQTPPEKKEPPKPQQPQNELFGGLDIPLLSRLKTDSDLTLIFGLLLILLNEKADKRLLFALIYILL